jgi:hypothetical protein
VDPLEVVKAAAPPIVAVLLLVSLAGARLLPMAVAIGLFIAQWLLRGMPPMPTELWSSPQGALWLLWSVIGGALVAQLEAFQVLRGKVSTGAGMAVAALAVWLVLQKQAARWNALDIVLYVVLGAVIAALLVVACRTIAGRAPKNFAPAVVFSVVLSIDAGLVAYCGASTLGLLCGAVAAASGAAAGTTLWRLPFSLSSADGTWVGVAHALFLLGGVHLGSLPWPAALCALSAPCAMLLMRPGLEQRPVTWSLTASLLMALPLGGALWFAFG